MKRTILQVDEGLDQLTIAGGIAGLLAGATVSLVRGCNHQQSGCNSFGNINNYGGDPWIPLKNPVTFVNQYV